MRGLFAMALVAFLCTQMPVVQASQSDVIVTVDSSSLRFSPSEVTVQEGQAVRFVWSGQALNHNAVADDGLFDSGEPQRDVDYRFVFEQGTAGEHTFVCEPHESVGMVGLVIVEPAPVIEIEEVGESQDTPSVSFLASLILVSLAAVFRSSSEE